MTQVRDFVVTEEELSYVIIPKETKTYKPVPYYDLIKMTKDGAEEIGLTLINSMYRATANRQVATARYDFTYGTDSEMGLSIAWQNSYNKQVSLKFAIGAHVFVCSNGACFGDIGAFKKKHTGEIQKITPEMIREYLSTATTVYEKMVAQKEKMKTIPVNDRQRAIIVGELYLFNDVLKETQVAIIKREFKKATFNYNAPDTLWELYNIITFALKEVHPADYLEVHGKVHEYFVRTFNLDEDLTSLIYSEKP
jgi:hypothetical protein